MSAGFATRSSEDWRSPSTRAVRTTDDIDALLSVPQIGMPGLFEALADRGFTVDASRNIRELRDDGLTTLSFGGVMIDLIRPLLPVFARVLDRALSVQILGQTVRVASPEGLIVLKLMAMRPQDEGDIQDLLAARAGSWILTPCALSWNRSPSLTIRGASSSSHG